MEKKKPSVLTQWNLNANTKSVDAIGKAVEGLLIQRKRYIPLGKENCITLLDGRTRHGSLDQQPTKNGHCIQKRRQSLDESASLVRTFRKSSTFSPLVDKSGSSGSLFYEGETPDTEVFEDSSPTEKEKLTHPNKPLKAGYSTSLMGQDTKLKLIKCPSNIKESFIQKSAVKSDATPHHSTNIIVYNEEEEDKEQIEQSGACVSKKEEVTIFPTSFSLAHDYVEDSLGFLQEIENRYTLSGMYPNVYHLTSFKRSVIVDWLIEVQSYLQLEEEVLFLTVRLLDKFLDTVKIRMKDAQLASIACLWIMSKYDALSNLVPSAKLLLSLCENQYNKKDLLLMEKLIIKHCRFNFNVGQPIDFLLYYLHMVGNFNKEIFHTSFYFLNIILLDGKFASKKPSTLAAGAIAATFSLHPTFGPNENSLKLWRNFRSSADVTDTKISMLKLLHCIQSEKTTFISVFKKFNRSKYDMLSNKIKKNFSKLLENMFNTCS